jgi:hypothetical protein
MAAARVVIPDHPEKRKHMWTQERLKIEASPYINSYRTHGLPGTEIWKIAKQLNGLPVHQTAAFELFFDTVITKARTEFKDKPLENSYSNIGSIWMDMYLIGRMLRHMQKPCRQIVYTGYAHTQLVTIFLRDVLSYAISNEAFSEQDKCLKVDFRLI